MELCYLSEHYSSPRNPIFAAIYTNEGETTSTTNMNLYGNKTAALLRVHVLGPQTDAIQPKT